MGVAAVRVVSPQTVRCALDCMCCIFVVSLLLTATTFTAWTSALQAGQAARC